MSVIVDSLIQEKINAFYAFVEKFCNDRKINATLENFLLFKSQPTQYATDSYPSLYRAPTELLISSKAFRKYYESLDADFKDDLFSEETYKRQTLLLTTQQSLQKVIKSYLKEDCIW